MPLEAELLNAILEKPDEDAPRLACADWCEHQNDPALKARAEFIRAQLELVSAADLLSHEDWYFLSSRATDLLTAHRLRWDVELNSLVNDRSYHRGFIELVMLPASAFLARAPALFALAPIRHLDLVEAHHCAAELFASPYLDRILSLSLKRCALDDADLSLLAASRHLGELRWLSLAENEFGIEGIEALARSPGLNKLVHADFQGNRVDPGEQCSVDNDLIMDRLMPEAGEALERRFGRLVWLHTTGDTLKEAALDRFALHRGQPVA
jgi:uncharacterized protein (TIGR02996 family)